MAGKDSQAVSGEVVDQEMGLAILSPQQLATFDAIMASVPVAGEDAIQRMVETIISAGSVDEIDAPWHGQKARELVGVPISISAIQQMPSDFEGGIGVYLVVRATRMDTGADATFTTGATMILWQLLVAWAREVANPGTWFPISVKIVEAPKHAPGRNPAQHLEVVR